MATIHWFMGPIDGSRCEQGARSARAVLFLSCARLSSPKKPRAKRWRGRENIAVDTRVGESEKEGEGKRKKTHAQKRNGKRSGAREVAAGRHTVLICQPSLFAIKDIPHLDKHVPRLVPQPLVSSQNRVPIVPVCLHSNRDAFAGRKETGLGEGTLNNCRVQKKLL